MGEVKGKSAVAEAIAEVKGFELPNEKVTIKFIKRNKGLAADVGESHVISGGMIEGATRSFCVPLLRNGGLKNVLTAEEKEFLEKGHFMGVNLSIYSDFWKTQNVVLEKLDTILDLSVPEDYLKYKILLAWDDVIAESLTKFKETNKGTYQFYMTRTGEELKDRSKKLDIIKSAWKEYYRIEDNRNVLISIIYLMSGKKVSENSTMKFINTEVETLVDTRTKDFLNLIEDPNFETKTLIALAESAGIVLKKNGKYETVDGLTLAKQGEIASLANAVKYLIDPKNHEVRDLIQARVENTK
jgi:hypothetical protein